jgi:hypothetical protein
MTQEAQSETDKDPTGSSGRRFTLRNAIVLIVLVIGCNAVFGTGDATEDGVAPNTASPTSSDERPSATRPPASETLKAQCALEADEDAMAFFDGGSVDTRRWMEIASEGAKMEYIRCIRERR